MSSWAAVVKKNSSSKVSQKEMKKAVKSAINESDREYNVIMFNVEEQDEEDPSENYDADTALDIMNSAGLDAVEEEYTTERIGALQNDKNRPLKVKFDFKSTAFDLLAKSKNLKHSEVYGTVFIVPDRSREERTPLHKSSNPFPIGRIRLRPKINLQNFFIKVQKVRAEHKRSKRNFMSRV